MVPAAGIEPIEHNLSSNNGNKFGVPSEFVGNLKNVPS